jgi:serine/threonine protein phosphatase PrpC
MNRKNPSDAVRWFGRSPLLARLDSPPPEDRLAVNFGALSQPGPARPVNGDHYLIVRLGRCQETLVTNLSATDAPTRFDEDAFAMIVADGLGEEGATASSLAISTLRQLSVYFGRWNLRIDEPAADEVIDRARRFYRGIDSTLKRAGQDRARTLQTTLTAVYIAGDELFFAHVGHSRAYLLREHELVQLTRDQTLEEKRQVPLRLVDVGSTVRDAHHILTDALGGPGSRGPRIHVERCGLVDGDIVLLCTNGLSDVVNEQRLASVLDSPRTPHEQCRALAEMATDAGTTDDVTVMVAHYGVSPRRKPE